MSKVSITKYLWFLSNFALFIVMTVSASSVSEASAEVASSALILPEEKGRSNWNQHRFIALVEKDITFTMETRSHQEKFHFWYKWDTVHLFLDDSQFESS
ncbi:hypothetical protein NPIL_543961 [Nephila pilipes]|uniref:Uncharacterized protein n=1 Tax=Nephila pilipes TaxID=299642 RepID=A0A8X6NFN5_NEPPI|nr:hypothetical protein NPIL_543961 [Nephila pilipes]